MWGRIAGIAEKIDANFGTDDDDDNVDGSASQSQSHEEDDAGVPTGGNAEGALMADDDDLNVDDEDGWGDDMDDFDDDIDFGDDDDDDDDDDKPPPAEPLENGSNGDVHRPESDKDAAALASDDAVSTARAHRAHDGDREDGAILAEGDAEVEMKSAASTANDAAPSDAAVGIEEESAAIADDNEEGARPPTPPRRCLPQSPPQPYDPPEIVTVSAPGKVLVAGGYLVLESPNPGVVLAAEGCRFHATVARRPPHSSSGGGCVVGNAVDASWESIPLDVYSPQFDRVFSYYLSYSLTTEEESEVSLRLQPRTGPHEPNVFVERTLLLTLGYLRRTLGAETFRSRLGTTQHRRHGDDGRMALAIKLRADNDFYSQIAVLRERGLDPTPQNLEGLEPFLPCPKDGRGGSVVVNKTGMGSSAALVTSLAGALLQFFGVVSLRGRDDEDGEDRCSEGVMTEKEASGDNNGAGVEQEGLRIVHNLSQICHCHAQGKVGSGFDVSSAVYGSHIYTRFAKGIVHPFLESIVALECAEKGGEVGLQLSEASSRRLVELVEGVEWDSTVRPISLPPGLELLMADVCGGSESPSMARRILDWKKNKRRLGFMDDYYWKDLKRCNQRVVSLLSDKLASQSFLDGLRRDGAAIISSRTAQQWKKPMPSSWHEFDGSSWDVALKLLDLRMAFLECRQNLRGMGRAAGVPVEPDAQSALADATMRLPGVVAAGVPGAGGYDALFVIYVKGPETGGGSSDQVRDKIGNLWKEMSDENDETIVCPLSVRAAGSGGGLCSTKLDW